MKLNKYGFTALLLAGILLVGFIGTKLYVGHSATKEEEGRFVIVTSFYPMYVATANLVDGMDADVVVENLSEPQTGCLHDYQLTTEDMQLLSTADVLVINGGGAEAFLDDVLAAYPDLIIIDACEQLEHHQEDTHGEHGEHEEHEGHEGHTHSELAHAWMCPSDYYIQIQTIASALCEVIPEYEDKIRVQEENYLGKIDSICREAMVVSLLDRRQINKVVILNEAFRPLCEEVGLEVVACMNMDEENQISAGDVANVVERMKEDPFIAILADEVHGKEMAETLAKETGAKIVYLNPLTRGELDKDGYLRGMKDNIKLIVEMLIG